MNFRDLLRLRPHPPQRTGLAAASRKGGSSTDGADQVHLWGHLISESLPRPIQRTQTAIYPQEVIARRMWALAWDSNGPGTDVRRSRVVREVHAGTIGRPGLRATNCWAGDPAPPSGKAPLRTLVTAATARARPKPTCLHRMYSNETSRGERVRL